MEKELWTVSETAHRLSLSRSRVYDLADTGVFTKRYIGARNWRIHIDDINAYVESLPTEPALP